MWKMNGRSTILKYINHCILETILNFRTMTNWAATKSKTTLLPNLVVLEKEMVISKRINCRSIVLQIRWMKSQKLWQFRSTNNLCIFKWKTHHAKFQLHLPSLQSEKVFNRPPRFRRHLLAVVRPQILPIAWSKRKVENLNPNCPR